MRRVLLAGIGNLFFGDDGFGCAVARRLQSLALPEGVTVRDFGIRGMDLAFALLDGYDGVVMIDAVRRGGAPGTLYMIAPEAANEAPLLAAHDCTPESVLALVRALGGEVGRLLLVGCEAAELGDEADPTMALSEPVERAVDQAVTLVLELASELARAPGAAHA